MAKKQTPKKELSPEELAQREENARLKRPIGVYVRKDVRIAVEEIAEKEDLTRHALLSYAISYFVRQYQAGKVKIEKQQVTKLKLDI